MPPTTPPQFIYLDVLRFFSFLFIFMHHCNFLTFIPPVDAWLLEIYPRFHLGVQLFFCLSAFLLTRLAMAEYEAGGTFSQWRFIIRRALRIFPLYYLFIALVFLPGPALGSFAGAQQVTLPPVLPYLLFYNNFIPGGLFMLVFLWSIAVEEQFYLFYSFVLKYLYKWLPWVAALLLAAYIIFRSLTAWNGAPNGHHTLNFLPCFAMGIYAALGYSRLQKLTVLFVGWRPLFIYAAGFWLLFMARPLYARQWFNVYEHLFYALLFCAIIVHLAQLPARNNSFEKITVFLGRRTYGLYVWHGLVLTLIYKKAPRWLLDDYFTAVFFPALGLTILLATLSYRLLEAPMLRLKNRFRVPGSSVSR